MDRFYEDADSLFVEAYDALHDPGSPHIAGDIAFYSTMAQQSGGAVLEIACGTGRVTLALAQAGLDVTGVDLSEGMLSVARRKAAALSDDARRRLTLTCQDMTALRLDHRFDFIFIPFRSFQHLLTVDLQRRALDGCHRHLEPGGKLALHLFDPRLDMLVDEESPPLGHSGAHHESGPRYVAEVMQTRLDHLAQVRRDLWRYAEIDADGTILCEDTREMALRWTYRWEFHHLLALSGFTVDAEYSDFKGSPPAYGKKFVIVARATTR